MLRKITHLLCVVLFSACVHPSRVPQHDPLLVPKLTSIVETQLASRQRLSGRFQARATGIKQFFGRVDVTIALQLPASFYFSIPSFFGMAARVVSSDGERFYLLDMTGAGPTFLTRPSDSETLEVWLGFPIEPREFVHLVLGTVDLEGATIVDALSSKRKGNAELRLRFANGNTKIVEFAADSEDLVSQHTMRDDKQLYRVDYSDFRETPKGRFPWRAKIAVQAREGMVELVMLGEELEFNDEPYERSTFVIEEP